MAVCVHDSFFGYYVDGQCRRISVSGDVTSVYDVLTVGFPLKKLLDNMMRIRVIL